MVAFNKRCINFILIVMVLGSKYIEAAGSNCDDQIKGLVSKCIRYVEWKGLDPKDTSKECCAVVKGADMKCVCDHVTKAVEAAVDMKKAVAVAAKCGRPIAPGTQCGTYHVHTARA